MDWWTIGALVGGVLLLPTAYAGIIGAPWAPTRMAAVKKAFDDIGISEKDIVIDLGAGDGSILAEALRRGARAAGYELSPIMWAIAMIRSRGNVVYGNFFKKKLMSNTTVVFFFLMPKHMKAVGAYIASQKLKGKTLVLSYAFPFKEIKALTIYREKNCAPLYLYEVSELRAHFDNYHP